MVNRTLRRNSFSGGASLGSFINMPAAGNTSATPNTYTDLFTPALEVAGETADSRSGENIVIMGMGNSVSGSDRYQYPAQGILINGSGNNLLKLSPWNKPGIMIHGVDNTVSGADDAWGANPSDEVNYGHGAAIMGSGNNIGHTYSDFIAGRSNTTLGYSFGPCYILGSNNSGSNFRSSAFVAGNSNTTITSGIYDTGMNGGCMIGADNAVLGQYCFTVGRDNTLSGNNMGAFGQGNTLSAASQVLGQNNTVGTAAGGSYIVGKQNVATTTSMMGVGNENTALQDSSIDSIFVGRENTVATTAYAVGTNQAPVVISLGYRNKIISPNTIAFGMSPQSVAVGTMQTSRTSMYIYANSSTTLNATPVPGVNQINIETDSTVGFKYTVTARRTDVDGGSAYWEGSGLIRNDAGTTALVDTVTKTKIASEGIDAADVNFTADNTNNGLIVTFTGEAAKTIRWYASVDCTSVVG